MSQLIEESTRQLILINSKTKINRPRNTIANNAW